MGIPGEGTAVAQPPNTRQLRPGEAVPLEQLTGGVAPATITASLITGQSDVDLLALLLADTGKVRTDDDLVFYNNPSSGDGAVIYAGQNGGPDSITIQLASLDADVDRVVLGCAQDTTATAGLAVALAINGQPVAAASITADACHPAMSLLEVYRRSGQWRTRLLAQGYTAGLAALVTDYGIHVENPAPTPTSPTPADATTSSSTPAPAAPPSPQRPDPLPAAPPATPTTAAPPSPGPSPTSPTHVGPGGWAPPPPAAMPATGQPLAAPPPTPTAPPPSWAPPPAAPSQPMPAPGSAAAPWPPPTQPLPNQTYPPVPGPTASMNTAPARPSDPDAAPRARGLFTSRKRQQLEAQNAELTRILATSGALDNAALERERQRLAAELAQLAGEAQRRRGDIAGLEQRLGRLRDEIAAAEGTAELVEVGVYNYRHRLDDAVAYKAQLDMLRDKIKATAKIGAVTGNTNWTVNGSLPQGRKMVNEVSKLMLRAYNADADHAVRTLRPYKLDTALTRLDTTRSTIARLGQTMDIRITDAYHRLRRDELALTADYLAKVEEEKERQREARERAREEQRAAAEFARERERLERERHRYSETLARLEERGDTAKAEEIRAQLAAVDNALNGVISREANLRAGHVYVISNIGAFGERMVKIGMTRRLDPRDRVRELGDASVPFRFDTHALIFSEDAVGLETKLHQHFAAQKVNLVNAHREFFYVTPAEVRDALAHFGTQYLIQYDEQAYADEWRQSGGPDRSFLPR